MKEAVIEARDITKQYQDLTALDHVDITVRRGDIYGLIGDNGAGKSTFLKIVTGQIYPTNGYIRFFGSEDEKTVQKNRARMGSLVENAGFYPKMSVEKNLEYYRIQRGIPGKEKVEEALRIVNLWEKRKVKCEKLSMGMKQRFGLALALMGEPELLVLDEPINGLDPSGIIEMRTLLTRLNQEKRITIVLSSHILSELEQIATAYGFLSHGCVLEEISAKALYEKCSNFIDIRLTEPDKYAAILEKKIPGISYRVLQDQSIRIANPTLEAARYSALAFEHGIGIQGLEEQHLSLEDYYVNIKNRGKLS